MKRRGASFETERVEIVAGSDPFRPTCIVRASPSTFYLSDWVGGSYKLHGLGRVWRLDVDVEKADWLTSREIEKPNQAAQLAEQLRSDTVRLSREHLFELARGDDAYLASAALHALSRLSRTWSQTDIHTLSERDRVSAAIASKLAMPSDQKRARWFLDDSTVAVQFEALRWISTEQLTDFLPDVEKLLGQSQVDYRLFEACLATWNILSGNPRAGISDPRMLLSRIKAENASDESRAFALRLIPPRDKTLSTSVLKKLFIEGDDLLGFEVVRTLSSRDDVFSNETLEAVALDNKKRMPLRVQATAGLAAVAEEYRLALVELAFHPQKELRHEALRGLRGVALSADELGTLQNATLQDHETRLLVASLNNPELLKQGRPAATDTAAWLKRLDMLDGTPDPRVGERIFHHAKVGLCSKCHRHNGRGSVVGPDLSAVANRGDRASLLQAILEPNRDVAPQFYPWNIVTEDGKSFTGILLRKGGSSGKEFYRDINGQERAFVKAEIELRRETKTSLMPKDLVDLLTDYEIRDLLAFLMEKP